MEKPDFPNAARAAAGTGVAGPRGFRAPVESPMKPPAGATDAPARSFQDLRPAMGKILWLASYPKSGNTWLRVFLHNLFRDPDEPYDINKLNEFCSADYAAIWYQQHLRKPAEEMTEQEVAALRPKVHEALTRVHPDTVFVKTHNALVESHGTEMVTMSQTAGAIYVVRNPLDVAISYGHHAGLDIDTAIEALNLAGHMTPNEANHVYQVYGSWSEHVKSWTGVAHPALHVMRYEDMLERPMDTFGAVAAFLGLRPTRERLQRAIQNSSFDELRKQEAKHGFEERSEKTTGFFREGRAGQWRETLTPAQIERIAGAHQEQMRRFGYWPPKTEQARAS